MMLILNASESFKFYLINIILRIQENNNIKKTNLGI